MTTTPTLPLFSRRATLAGGIVLGAGLALPALAQEDNPMPAELRKALERDPNAPVLGNPDGNITLTEFFDYNCPYCRLMVRDVHGLILEDKELRIVFREWAVFGEGSIFAAQASLASLDQGKYWQMHSALMAIKGRAEEASVLAAAETVGLDMAKLRRDMESDRVFQHMSTSGELADHMALMGTPTFIAGNEGLFGKQSPKDLRDLVARGRKALG
ncbi:DsbA family protein [Paracoccus cavernae]